MTDDITNDLALLDDWLAGKGYGEEAGLCMRAMDLIRKQADEIEKLRAELVEAQRFASEMDKNALAKAETCTMLMKDNEKLRAALKPFADVAEHDICDSLTDADIFRPITSEHSRASVLTIGDLRAAKAALGESDE